MSVREAFSLIRNTSLASVLEREIEAMVLSGELKPGERVPEIQIAERFMVSRSPVREAVRALDAVGIVEIATNRGAFVRRIALDEALEVYEVRSALFAQAGRLMATRGSDAHHAELLELHQAMGEASVGHDFDRYFPLNFQFHDLIVEAAQNRTLASQYRMLVKRLRLFRARNLMFGDTLEISNAEHQRIVDAILRRDEAAAGEACFDHVEAGRRRVVERVRQQGDAVASDPAFHQERVPAGSVGR